MAGESLLKIIDYPFAYSVVTVISAIIGFSITTNKIFLLGIAGALGTLLSIVDPLGWVVRNNLKDKPPISEKMVNYPIVGSYFLSKESVLHSRAVTIEIDKIISMIYFAITSGIFLVGILVSPFLADNFIIHNKLQEVVCDSNCVKITTGIGSGFVCVVLGIIGSRRWSELTEKIAIAITHQRAISNEFVTTNSLENMTRSLEQNDWVTAEKWGEKIEKEIEVKKGKKDMIVKGIEKVYRPLHKDSLVIEDRCNQLATGRPYPYFDFNEWQKINTESDYIYLEDKELLHNIGGFYGTIQDYDYRLGICATTVNEIILRKASEKFGKKVQRIEYFNDVGGGEAMFRLIDCAILGVHPKDKYQGKPSYVDLNFLDDAGHSQNYKTPTSELKIFDIMWDEVISEVKNNEHVRKMKELFDIIQRTNQELKQKYFEKISEEVNL